MENQEGRIKRTTINYVANEMRSYMEQNNQTLINQMERSSKALVQALQNMGNSISNNLKDQSLYIKDTSSNHSENNNVSSRDEIPHPVFLPRGELLREEEGVEQPINWTKDIARAYAKL